MSHDKAVGEVASEITSLINNRNCCLFELLGNRQCTEILEDFFVTF